MSEKLKSWTVIFIMRNRHILGRKKSARLSISENSPAIDVSRRVPFGNRLDRVKIEKNTMGLSNINMHHGVLLILTYT